MALARTDKRLEAQLASLPFWDSRQDQNLDDLVCLLVTSLDICGTKAS